MTLDPATAMMLAKIMKDGIDKKVGGVKRLFQPKFQNTKYGKYIKGVKNQGNLTGGQEATILNKVGANTSNMAQVSTNKAIGSSINQGMGNSIANNRLIRDAELNTRRNITDAGKEIDISEANAMRNAEKEYAMAMDKDKQGRTGAWWDVITPPLLQGGNSSDVGNIAGNVTQRQNDTQMNQLISNYSSGGKTNADKDALLEQLTQLVGRDKAMETILMLAGG